jgi:AraC-like DNA-binding protein
MDLVDIKNQVVQFLPPDKGTEPRTLKPLPALAIFQHDRLTAFEATLYEPVICLIVQGKKETVVGDHMVEVAAGDVLLISHDLPVTSRITEAPYISLLLDVEIATLRSLYDEVAETALDSSHARAIEVYKADHHLLDALQRYIALASSRIDTNVLGPLILKEIHYRLLMAPFGGMLRHLVWYDSPASAIARAIAHIRRDFRSSISVPELAEKVGMSTSSFHKHFKEVTFSTPLQYQKDLRLLEARRLLLTSGATVSTAAYEVGYESPTQFSREYARKYGLPPSKDIVNAPSQPIPF